MSVELLKVIQGESEHWVELKMIHRDLKIESDVQTISCDTRDFAIAWGVTQPEPYKKTDCNHEYWTNNGLKRMEELKQSDMLQEYLIQPDEILPWLTELYQKSGGEREWRYLVAKVENCGDWNIKYIRFVRHGDCFIVCNSYMCPIRWKQVVENLYDPMTERTDESSQELNQGDVEYCDDSKFVSSEENMSEWQTYSKPVKKVIYHGICCQRCKNRFKESEWCKKHCNDDKCWRFKLER